MASVMRGTHSPQATSSGALRLRVAPHRPSRVAPLTSARVGAAPGRHLRSSRLPLPLSAAASSFASTSAAQPTTASTTATAAVDDFATDSRPVILFDGVCNLCNNGVNFMLDNDPGSGVYRLAALQSPAGRRLLQRCGRSPDDISSIVLVERDSHYIRSEAILRIGWKLRVPLPLLAAFGFPVPLPLRDAFYDTVANNRYNFFGRTDSCRLDDGRFKDRFLVN